MKPFLNECVLQSCMWKALLVACGFTQAANVVADDGEVSFEQQVAPLLISHCLECHSPTTINGGLLLSTDAGLHNGGDSGPAVNFDDVDASLLLQRVEHAEMPPPQQGQPRRLSDDQIATLRIWIAAGAPWPEGRTLDLFEQTTSLRAGRDWWSLRPVSRPDVPTVQHVEMVRNPIDAFIVSGLETAGLVPAPTADPRTRLRRLYYDLTGLPPSFEELEAFAADPSDSAWEAQIDRLLASPQYGERWGRYWLDVVRYADTSGYERDQEKPYSWRYRDWVVEAFNSDMPYDEFIVSQLAGDEVEDRTESSVVATGFLRLGTWNDEPNDPEDYKYERLEDLVHATSSAFLGLTVKCARCHDHKFDPIPQLDYYRMAAAFWPGPIEPRERELLGGPSIEELGFDEVLGWTDVRTDPPEFHLLEKGDRHRLGPVVDAEELSFLPELSFVELSDEHNTTGNRLRLAEWIADDDNPLTPRVMVNRLWLHHFGEGLVRSVNNFGFQGDQPTHPELLDWLASEFIANGWQLKPLHKLILMSSTWQQSADHPDWEGYAQIDAANRLWWRAERRRLDAEALRDSLLTAAGVIDLQVGGPGFRPDIAAAALEGLSRKDADWVPSDEAEQHRRSLYIFNKRGLLPPLMTTFDQCDSTLPCGQRDVTTVPSQSLTLLNNPFTHDCSRQLAARVLEHAGSEVSDQIVLAWQMALARTPDEIEITLAQSYLDQQASRFAAEGHESPAQKALESLCHALLNSNEFVYVD